MEMPDVIYLLRNSNGGLELGPAPDYYCDWLVTVTYHHSRIVEALRRENEELKAKLDKAKWQPIETAPRDGREVILSLWSGSYATPETSLRWAINGYFKDGFWYSKDPTIGRLADPTHWMPIKPPTMQGE